MTALSGLEFSASLIDSLAWPVLVGVVLIVMRHPIGKVLKAGAIKVLKLGPQGFEAEFFDQRVEQAKAELPVPTATETQGEVALTGEEFLAEMTDVANLSPRAAVLESFARLEALLRQSVEVQDVAGHGRRPVNVRQLGGLAVKQDLLEPGEQAALNDVTALRNTLTHTPEVQIDKASAIEYVEIIRQLMISLLLAQGITAASPASGLALGQSASRMTAHARPDD